MSGDALSMILGALVRLEAKTDRIERQLSGIRDDIGIDMARADRVAEAGKNTRKEVRLMAEELAGMWRKVNRPEETVRGLTRRGDGEPADER